MVLFAYTTGSSASCSAACSCATARTAPAPSGCSQPIADLVKLVRKEAFAPARRHELLYIVAPVVSMFTALLAFSVIPFGRRLDGRRLLHPGEVVNVPISLILIFALGSIGIYGFIVGGWASRVEVLDPRLDAHVRAARLVRGVARAQRARRRDDGRSR